MNELKFIWDRAKNASNKKKHRITFEEAQSVFFDENAIEYFDPEHSNNEDRFLMLGLSFNLSVLVVCHCLRDKGSTVRIISARRATKQEAQSYWEARA